MTNIPTQIWYLSSWRLWSRLGALPSLALPAAYRQGLLFVPSLLWSLQTLIRVRFIQCLTRRDNSEFAMICSASERRSALQGLVVSFRGRPGLERLECNEGVDLVSWEAFQASLF